MWHNIWFNICWHVLATYVRVFQKANRASWLLLIIFHFYKIHSFSIHFRTLLLGSTSEALQIQTKKYKKIAKMRLMTCFFGYYSLGQISLWVHQCVWIHLCHLNCTPMGVPYWATEKEKQGSEVQETTTGSLIICITQALTWIAQDFYKEHS